MKHLTISIFCASLCACSAGHSVPMQPLDGEWAVPSVSTAHIRTLPRHSTEMSSQALMGTPLRLSGKTESGWYLIETPEGYSGYINGNTLHVMSDSAFMQWKSSARVIVTSTGEINAYSDTISLSAVSDLVPGCILQGEAIPESKYTHITLPDGREGFVETCFITGLDGWADQIPDPETIEETAARQMGTPYLWGGLSSKGMDCSGLTKMAYYQVGVILPRDASQQAVCGIAISPDSLQKGDLVFFGNTQTGSVNHVGVYDADGYFIESAGRVKRSPLADNNNFLFAQRIIGTADSLSAKKHPWYFIIDKN